MLDGGQFGDRKQQRHIHCGLQGTIRILNACAAVAGKFNSRRIVNGFTDTDYSKKAIFVQLLQILVRFSFKHLQEIVDIPLLCISKT